MAWRRSTRTGTWETASDWTPAGEPGGDDIAEIVLGTVTEDVNQPLLTSQNQVNPGVVVGALTISSRGALVIGDSAGVNRAIMTIDDTQSTFIAGSVTVYDSRIGAEPTSLVRGYRVGEHRQLAIGRQHAHRGQ